MAYTCPHCEEESITGASKWWAGPIWPAKCASCGGLSVIPQRWYVLLGAADLILFTFLTFVAIEMGEVLVAVVAAAVVALLGLYSWHRVKLVRLPKASVQPIRRWEWGLLLALAVGALAVLFMSNAEASNLSIERTAQSLLRSLWSAAHVGR